MKKLFSDKKEAKKSFLEFFDKKGFYIILILCIAIVGATAIFVTTHNATSSNGDFSADKLVPGETESNLPDLAQASTEDSPIDTAAVSNEQQTATNKAAESDKATASQSTAAKTDIKKADAGSQSGKAVEASKTTTPSKPSTSKGTTASKNQKFILPVIGEITFDYAQDKLAYSKTLEEWRTHSGVDIGADRGTPVKAAADGVISEVKNDPRLGIIVVIDHQNGLKSVYANLASDEMVNPNQKVEQGEIIGSVGDTALFESAEQSHLHFEVLKDNEPADPHVYLPEK